MHTLALAEALAELGQRVTVYAVAPSPGEGFFRAVDPTVSVHLAHRTPTDDLPIAEHELGLAARNEANHYVTGRDGYRPVWRPDATESDAVDLMDTGIRSVIWATGFRSDWSWVTLPAFDGHGYPTHERGVTSVAGLYVLGLPWLHTWGSGRFAGIARDAEHVASHASRAVSSSVRRRLAA